MGKTTITLISAYSALTKGPPDEGRVGDNYIDLLYRSALEWHGPVEVRAGETSAEERTEEPSTVRLNPSQAVTGSGRGDGPLAPGRRRLVVQASAHTKMKAHQSSSAISLTPFRRFAFPELPG